MDLVAAISEAAGPDETHTGAGIPRTIHQVWIGRNPKPEAWMNTVKDFCKKYGYEYKLWSTADIDRLGIDDVPGLRGVFRTMRSELAGQADILRLLFLYKYGGIYIDADSVIMRPAKFDKFLDENKAAVFFGWENLSSKRVKKLGPLGGTLRGTRKLIANGLIGARKEHAFIRRLLEEVVANAKSEKKGAWRQVGPLFVTRIWSEDKDLFPDVHIYPMRYFYPMHWGGIKDPFLHEKVKIPPQSMLFQYGYSTNKFADIFRAMAMRKTRRATKQKGGQDD